MATGTVLVVDDDAAIVDFMTDALEYDGYTVLRALGSAALSVAHAERPDVILLDMTMPEMNGVEMSQRLRSDPVTAHIPIVLMSAEWSHAVSARRLGEAWLAKPFHLRHLYAMVARWMPVA